MFRPYERWRHMSTLDLDVEFAKTTYSCLEYIKAKVWFINRSMTLPENQLVDTALTTVKIYRKDFWKWKKV